ncbi:MAG: hypothetical protein IJS54_05685 [Desulfovibrio sp.]|nr:hypothetical protein [Desulfovibrio sp.]
MADSLLLRINAVLRRHKCIACILVLVLWCLSLGALQWMRTDTGIASFFPDKDRELHRMSDAFAFQAKTILLDLESDGNGDLEEQLLAMAQGADAIAAHLPPDLAHVVRPSLPDPEAFMRLVPSYFDASMEKRVEQFLADPSVQAETAKGLVRTLSSLLGTGYAAEWLVADPLGLRFPLLARLPNTQHIPLPDPALGYPVSSDRRHLLMVLTARFSLKDVEKAVALVEHLRASLRASLPKGITVTMTGGTLYSAHNRHVIHQDSERIVLWSVIGFSLVYLLFVRSLGALWLVMVPLVAASVSLGMMALCVPLVSALAVGFGASMLGVCEDYAVHAHFALRAGGVHALAHIGKPLFQGFLVNASGFCVLLASGIPAIRQIALFSLGTLVLGFCLAVTLLPVLPWFASPRNFEHKQCCVPMVPKPWAVLGCVVFLALAIAGLWTTLRIDVSPQTLGADSALFAENAQKLRSLWGIAERPMLLVQGETKEDVLAKTRELVAMVRRENPTVSIVSLADLWISAEERADNCARWQRCMARHARELAEALARLADEAGLKGSAFAPFLASTSSQPCLIDEEQFRLAGLGDLLDRLLTQTETRWQSGVFPDASVEIPRAASDWTLELVPGRFEALMRTHFAQEVYLVPLAWFCCFCLLFFSFRNIWQALLSALPPLCSLLSIVFAFAVSGHALSMAGLAAMPLVLGLSCDHGIMVTHDLSAGVSLGVERAVWVSTLTTLTGMGLLAIAHHPSLAAMGEVIFFGLLVEIPCALSLLPLCCEPKAS